MTWSATYDLSNDVGAIRLLLRDIDLTIAPSPPSTNQSNRTQWTVLFADEELSFVYNKYSTDFQDPIAVYYAAAELIESLAFNNAYIAKRRKLGDYEKDTEVSPKLLQAEADRMRAIANNLPFEMITEVAWSDANYARILYNRFLTGQ